MVFISAALIQLDTDASSMQSAAAACRCVSVSFFFFFPLESLAVEETLSQLCSELQVTGDLTPQACLDHAVHGVDFLY